MTRWCQALPAIANAPHGDFDATDLPQCVRYTDEMAVRVRAMETAALVELVNEWGTTPRAAAREEDDPYPPRAMLSGRLGIPKSATPRNDQDLVALADRLHPIFATKSVATRVRLVNALLTACGVRPTLTNDDTVTGSWLVDDPSSALLAAAAITLRTQFIEHSAERLGACVGRRCADVYIDSSPTGQRRFCSLTCQNRARVAAFRRRKATQT